MPGYGASSRPHRISLAGYDGSDNWVDIREGRSSAAAARVNAAAVRMTGVSADGTPSIGAELNLAAMRLQLFRESILAWSLTRDEADTEPMPLNDTSFEQLDGDVATWLDGEITAYYARRRRTPEQLGNSAGPSKGP